MEQEDGETRAMSILKALEEMSKGELLELCQNLEQTIHHRDQEIDRINSHYEHLLSLYYEAEEKLALLNQELFLSRAQTHASLDWGAALSTTEITQIDDADNKDLKENQEDDNAQSRPNTDKPPANPRRKSKKSASHKTSDVCFLSKTMTPVLHRRTSAQQRRENACARSTPHAPLAHAKNNQVMSSWSEPFRSTATADATPGHHTPTKRSGKYDQNEESSSEESEDDVELSRDTGIIVNDANILTIHHDSSPSPPHYMGDTEQEPEDAVKDYESAQYARTPQGRTLTPFHSERPHTAETAGSDGSRPPTGEKLHSPDPVESSAGHQVNSIRPKSHQGGNSGDDNTGHDQSAGGGTRAVGHTGRVLARSENFDDHRWRSSHNESKNGGTQPGNVGARTSHTGHRLPVSKSVNFSEQTAAIGLPLNENRNSHNNNEGTPNGYHGNPTTATSTAGRSREGGSPTDDIESPRDRDAEKHGTHISVADDTIAYSPRAQRSVSLDILSTIGHSTNQKEENPKKPTSVSDLFKFSTLNLKCVDEIDGIHKIHRLSKIRYNPGAVFSSYDNLHSAILAEKQAKNLSQSSRYPARIPHAPAQPKRPRPETQPNTRRRSKSLNQTFPPNRSMSAESAAKKPPSGACAGAGAFDFSKLRQRNRAALSRRPLVADHPTRERSPSPLRITGIRSPLSASYDTTGAAHRASKDFGLRRQPLHGSLDCLPTWELSSS